MFFCVCGLTCGDLYDDGDKTLYFFRVAGNRFSMCEKNSFHMTTWRKSFKEELAEIEKESTMDASLINEISVAKNRHPK